MVTQQNLSTIAFEENRGQYDPRVLFVGKGGGQTVFLTADEAAFVWPMPEQRSMAADESGSRSVMSREAGDPQKVYALKMKLSGANLTSEFAGEGEIEGRLNYFKGSDPAKWATDVPRYASVTAEEVYEGIGLKWYGREDGRLEYDFIVAPGTDTTQIKLEFDGADSISIDPSGDLVIETPAGTVRHGKPIIYQEADDAKHSVEGSYEIADGKVGFSLGDYDRSKTLVIDPIPGPPITYSTYLGGNMTDELFSVKVDLSNNVYVTGQVTSTDFPITSGFNNAFSDACVTKLNSTATAIIYSVLIGGSSGEWANSLAINSAGNVFIAGITGSTDFPVSIFADDRTYNGGTADAFVAKLSSTGTSLLYSTYLGGSLYDKANELDLDADGSAYVTGITESANFPTTTGALDRTMGGDQDPFVTKVNSSGSALTYSTYLGDSSDIDEGNSIAVDSLGRAYVVGTTNYSLNKDCFIKKLNSAGSALVYGLDWGGSGDDQAHSVAIDASGNAYVVGQTSSTAYPITFAAFDSSYGTGVAFNGFVSKINSSGTGFLYSTYLGGDDGSTFATGIVLDSSNSMFITGRTYSPNFPTTFNAYDRTLNTYQDVFLTKLDAAAFASPSASTYIGGNDWEMGWGIAINRSGDAFLVGSTQSADYPTTFGVIDRTYGPGPGGGDGFITRYNNYWLP
jgi:hypothetical protein